MNPRLFSRYRCKCDFVINGLCAKLICFQKGIVVGWQRFINGLVLSAGWN